MPNYRTSPDTVASLQSAQGGANITPADSDLATVVRAIRVVVGGVVRVTGLDGDIWDANFLAGETRALMVVRIWATGTTATGIEALY